MDAGGKSVLDDDGNPVKGILQLRQDEADALAQARRDVLDGATVGGIARNRNAGLMEYRCRITGTAQWPPIVDETTWRATVAKLGDPSRKTILGPARRHLLTWLARCGGPLWSVRA